MYRNTNATTASATLRASGTAGILADADDTDDGRGVCHLPSNRTERGAERAVAMAPCRKIAWIIPPGNRLERNQAVSTCVATVEMPYMLTHMAPTRRQPCQLDLKMRYDTAAPTQIEKVTNESRKFSGG